MLAISPVSAGQPPIAVSAVYEINFKVPPRFGDGAFGAGVAAGAGAAGVVAGVVAGFVAGVVAGVVAGAAGAAGAGVSLPQLIKRASASKIIRGINNFLTIFSPPLLCLI
jgi:hypothetical protein